MSDSEEAAVRLRDVVFSYVRDATLPDSEALTGEADPDERAGPVLRGVDMSVPDGSFTVVMGASGGGKSTLLRTFNAIIPDFIDGSFRGEVDVLGVDATETRVSEMARDVGMVLQDYESQLFGTSVEAEVAFGPENLAVPPAEIEPRIEQSLSIVGLDDLELHREPSGLSGGQKQRLVFAGVAATHPELLVLDEPTSDLDPKGTRDIVDVVNTLSAGDAAGGDWSGPDTIAMVTHKIEEALLADHAVLLKDGKPYRSGTVREVFTDTDALAAARVAVPRWWRRSTNSAGPRTTYRCCPRKPGNGSKPPTWRTRRQPISAWLRAEPARTLATRCSSFQTCASPTRPTAGR
ncbi:putative ABC transporter ATP-binding protein [Halolamina pelagica]|uniref:Putative ABC transporter ATP-binding protein n=1 Tax=Halolamina pelagica TaxID=699431 RepID=A0A0P7GBC0_9EURY|nr:ATP-binding cassette domain-containing protein [Halolamina pelagica]KPN30940.1 putative ABC transporter ATP-binding protein [Halolamina pelagica]